ncbi:MAG: hypothetical protein WC977_11010 [Anaerovoracaceae bacterium]|jgi:hypothetical protein
MQNPADDHDDTIFGVSAELTGYAATVETGFADGTLLTAAVWLDEESEHFHVYVNCWHVTN